MWLSNWVVSICYCQYTSPQKYCKNTQTSDLDSYTQQTQSTILGYVYLKVTVNQLYFRYFQQFVIIGSFCTNRRTLNNTVKIVCLFWKVCPTADYIMLTWNTRISCLLIVCVQSGNSSFSLGTPVSVEIPVSGREFPHRKVQVLVPVSCETARNHMASSYMTNIQEVDQEISYKLNYPS